MKPWLRHWPKRYVTNMLCVHASSCVFNQCINQNCNTSLFLVQATTLPWNSSQCHLHHADKVFHYLTRARSEPTSDLGKAVLGNCCCCCWVWSGFGMGLVWVCPQLFRESCGPISMNSLPGLACPRTYRVRQLQTASLFIVPRITAKKRSKLQQKNEVNQFRFLLSPMCTPKLSRISGSKPSTVFIVVYQIIWCTH